MTLFHGYIDPSMHGNEIVNVFKHPWERERERDGKKGIYETLLSTNFHSSSQLLHFVNQIYEITY